MKKLLFRNNIFKKHLISFIVVMLIPVGMLGTKLYQQFYTEYVNNIIYYDSSLHNVATQKLNQFLYQVDDITNILLENDIKQLLYYPEDNVHQSLKNKIQLEEKIKHKLNFYNFVDEIQNVIILANNEVYNIGKYGIAYDYDYKRFINSGDKIASFKKGFLMKPHTQAYLPFHKSDKLVLTYVKPLTHINQRTDDFVMITINIDKMMNSLNELTEGKINFYIVDKNKKPLLHVGSQVRDILSHIDLTTKGTVIQKLDDKNYSISNKRVNDFQLYLIGVKELEDTFFKSNYIIRLFLPIILLSLIISLIISSLLSYSLIRPIRLLRRAMLKVDEGDLDSKAQIVTDDEIGDLSQHFNDMIGRINDLINKVLSSELKEKEARLSALQAQINPHFIYNTLDNISSIAYLHDVHSISELSEGLSNMLRYNVKRGQSVVTIRDEVNQIVNYYKIMNIRYDGKLKLSLNMDDEVLDLKILRLTLQPIVENSIYHGIDKKDRRGTITIHIKEQTDYCIISIRDDGIGIGRNKLNKIKASLNVSDDHGQHDSGIGLKNVIDRLKLYYGDSFTYDVKSEQHHYTEIIFRIPKYK